MAPTSAKSPTPMFGFDMLATRIAACLHSANPYVKQKPSAVNNATTAAAAVARTPPPKGKKDTVSHGVKSNYSRLINSQFKASIGKQSAKKRKTPQPSSSPTFNTSSRRSKRRKTSRHGETPSARVADTPVPHFNLDGIDATSLVLPHKPIPISSQSSFYKRLLPGQIARLSKGDEIIIVIPRTTKVSTDATMEGIQYMNGAIDSVLSHTCAGATANERRDEMKRYRTRHEIKRDGDIAHQFSARITNYSERWQFEDVNHETQQSVLKESDLDAMWNDIGINVEVCGYAKSKFALLKMKYIGYIEIYQIVKDGSILNDNISFSTGDIEKQLVDNFWAVNGCAPSAIEAMMKYYAALAARQKNANSALKRRQKAFETKANADVEAATADATIEHNKAFASLIKEEITQERLFAFADKVDRKYHERFHRQYSTFTKFSDYMLPGDTVVTLYDVFRSSFPYTHTMFARIISSKYDLVNLADPLKSAFDEEDDADMPETAFDENELSNNECSDDESKINRRLGKKERAILEYFLSLIRLRSQKQLRWWSQMTPLGYFSKGFKQPGGKSHLNGASCTLRTAHNHLDNLADECAPNRMEMVQQQLTQSAVLDNWQTTINKLYQDEGKSSLTQKGTAHMSRRDKALVLPPKTIIRSPLGIKYSISHVQKVDTYTTRVFGTPVDGQDIDSDIASSQVRNVKDNGFLWPRIDWDVLHIPGVDQCKEISYLKQYIPAPLGARLHKDTTADDLIFEPRSFPDHGDVDSKILTTDEYHKSLIRSNQFIAMNSFGAWLHNEHSIEDDKQQRREEDVEAGHDVQPEPSIEFVSQRKAERDKEEAFISSMGKCSVAMYNVNNFHSDVTKQVNPSGREIDSFYCFPIYPRDETTKEGMMLVCNKVNESVGLIEEVNGDYVSNKNTKKRRVFLHGDALSVVNHGSVRPRIARRATHIGNDKHVAPLLEAMDSTFMQKGHFHQLMHQSAAIYSLYYGGFLQPLQVACAVKRVNGDPVKGKFQDHERWLIKVHKACTRHLIRSWISSCTVEFLTKRDDESQRQLLMRLEESLNAFIDWWLDSNHEPTHVVIHFMKCMDSYLRCKHGISKLDFWELEKESCEWLALWKLLNKTTYLRLQCEYIEHVYSPDSDTSVDFPSWLREVMRLNNICVLTDTLKGVAFDHVNELFNYYLKIPPTTPYIETACKRSTHCMTQRNCAIEIFESNKKRSTMAGATEKVNIKEIEDVLRKSDIFILDEAVSMTDTYFWSHVKPKKNVGTVNDKSKEIAQATLAEEKLRERLCQPETVPRVLHQ